MNQKCIFFSFAIFGKFYYGHNFISILCNSLNNIFIIYLFRFKRSHKTGLFSLFEGTFFCGGFKYAHKFFDASPFKWWSLIPLLLIQAGLSDVILMNKIKA